ncbi:MAG: ECF transporter S component [Tissierellia bacterium]|nr:ECF transporter S component [Tissierellia bacterium]
MNKNLLSTKRLTSLAMFAAIAYMAVFFIRIPVVMFLKYEPKDVIISIAGFIFGAVPALIVTVVVSFVEMITISTTGPIGCIMNILATSFFALPAAIAYKKHRNIKSAIYGLLIGTVLMTLCMLLWNYLLTPLYLHVPREEVIKILGPVILPFNIFKGLLNAGFTILLYKPLVMGLRYANLAPTGPAPEKISLRKSLVSACILIAIGLAISQVI